MPDQTEQLNALELAVLQRMAASNPFLLPVIADLRVTSREFTDVGTFTNIEEDADYTAWDGHIGIDVPIDLPDLKHGLCAVLFCRRDRPVFLELVMYGEPWGGSIEGFRLEPG